jgi:hypothetical protein
MVKALEMLRMERRTRNGQYGKKINENYCVNLS